MYAKWYFDLISPYSYLHLKQFGRLPADVEIEYVPTLFAGVLKHYGHKGPAEIPPKRVHTYRQSIWLAGQLGIPFTLPPAHPFNPIHALRLVLAAGPSRGHVETAFDMAWQEARDLQDPKVLEELARRLHIKDAPAVLSDERIKARLKANTDAAIAQGVFGVPTFQLGGELFWGQDSLEMMLDYLKDPGLFESAEMRRATGLPVGTARREVSKS